MRASCLVGSLVALAIGCGDDGVSIDTSESTVCAEIAEVACHNMYRCCTEGEIQDFLGVSEPRDEDQCREDFTRACARSTAPLAFAIEEGRVRFEPDIMNGCLATLVAPDDTCAEVVAELPWAEACMHSAWVGVVETDGLCFADFECAGAPDSDCASNQKCTPRPGHGQPCGTGCANDFYCATSPGNPTPLCQPRLPVGALCASTGQCQPKLFCDLDLPMPACVEPAADGAPCISDGACASGDCIPGTCEGTTSGCFTSEECSGRCADDGSFCADAGDCAPGNCMSTGFSCFSPTDCGTSDTCVFPVQCVPGTCVGDPVCRASQFTVDYCEDALTQLPGI